MKRIAFLTVAAAAVVALSFVLSGCGVQVPGVPSTVATVNGESIPAAEYLADIHKKMGEMTLRNMIEQKIMLQWAEEENVAPTKEQIDAATEALKRMGFYENVVEMFGEDGVRYQLENQQARANLARKFIDIEDAEAEQFYESSKTAMKYVHGPQKQVAVIMSGDKEDIEAAEKAIKEGGDFDEVGAEYGEKQMTRKGVYKTWLDEGEDAEPRGFLKDFGEAAKDLKVNEVSKVFSIIQEGMPNEYAVLKVLDTRKAEDLKFEDVKEEVKDSIALRKSGMDTSFQKKLNDRKREAEIDINIEEFAGIAAEFKNPPEPMMPPMQAQPQPAPKEQAEPKEEAEPKKQ